MLDTAEYRELRNGKRYETSIERTVSDHGSTGDNATGISSENVEGEISEIQTLTQELSTRKLEGLSLL